MSTFVVAVYSDASGELLREYAIVRQTREDVRASLGFEPSDPPEPIKVTDEIMSIVDGLVDERLVVAQGEVAYIEEHADFDGEQV